MNTNSKQEKVQTIPEKNDGQLNALLTIAIFAGAFIAALIPAHLMSFMMA